MMILEWRLQVAQVTNVWPSRDAGFLVRVVGEGLVQGSIAFVRERDGARCISTK
jgi:hypothetical protein